jgi:hypothetical protein
MLAAPSDHPVGDVERHRLSRGGGLTPAQVTIVLPSAM